MIVVCLLLTCSFAWAADSGTVKTVAAIDPIAYFVDRVGGPHAAVDVLVTGGQNPHTFEPTPRLVASVSEAQLYFKAGLPFEERLLAKILPANPKLAVADLRQGVKMRPFTAAEAHDGDDHGDKRGEPDPHFWLDPENAKLIGASVARTLAQADPAHAADFQANLGALQADLDRLNQEMAGHLSPYRGRAFYTYHPDFGYFADRYGLRQVAIETSGREPSAKDLVGMVAQAKADGIKAIFVERQFSPRAAQALASEIGARVIVVDPLARNYIDNLRDMAGKLGAAFGDGK